MTERDTLEALLAASAARHSHLCPRQVLGVRMGLHGGQLLGLPVPQSDKRLLTVVETDGCAADGVAVATGCAVGRRTLRVEDYGKVAATLVDTETERAVRVVPHPASRERAATYAPEAEGRWAAMLHGYKRMPAEELLSWRAVRLRRPVAEIISRPGVRAECAVCGEEIINEREVARDGRVLCRACADGGYYRPA